MNEHTNNISLRRENFSYKKLILFPEWQIIAKKKKIKAIATCSVEAAI